ncbi:unnamed protein product [Protopolystoma xenopodis]|uniref:Uncharacterized protein n=1 Tax=Protopolystoma xenopodis TaxID=117903 RepID=A0A3S5CRV7_9PLAT|nr:unnamed protein product [Protopolystoma xenopodis]
MLWYLMLRASASFLAQYDRWPGTHLAYRRTLVTTSCQKNSSISSSFTQARSQHGEQETSDRPFLQALQTIIKSPIGVEPADVSSKIESSDRAGSDDVADNGDHSNLDCRRQIKSDPTYEEDVPLLRTHLNRVLRAYGIDVNGVNDDYVRVSSKGTLFN